MRTAAAVCLVLTPLAFTDDRREPQGGDAPPMRELLRNCRKCHAADATRPWSFDNNFNPRPHKVWFTERGDPVWGMTDDKIIAGIGVVLRSAPSKSWHPTPDERAGLETARTWLERKAR